MGANITQASDWKDWKKTCAFLNCADEARKRLGQFGISRMLKRLKVISESLVEKFKREDNPIEEAWHWLDIHIIEKDSRGGLKFKKSPEGKACKDWLFQKPGLENVSDVEQYFSTGFFRAAAQEYARENLNFTTSLDQPVGPSEDSLTLGDLLPGDLGKSGENLEVKEFVSFVKNESEEEFTSFKDETKVALAASSLGITLAAPEIKDLTGKGKSALYDHVKRANLKVFDRVRNDPKLSEIEPSEDSIKMIVENSLEELAEEWAKNPESPAYLLFELV